MVQPSKDFIDFINNQTHFVVAGHSEPDGDCLSSSIVLASVLRKIGKKAIAYNEGPFHRGEINEYENEILSEIPIEYFNQKIKPSLILVDCSTPNRIGKISEDIDKFSTAVIDHHASGDDFGDVRFIDIESPSTTLLIQRLTNKLNIKLDENEANLLFFGFCTDTGFFKHLSNKRHEEMNQVAQLMQEGADPKKCYYQMTGGKTVESRLFLGRLLSRIEFHHNKSVIIIYDTKEDIQEFGEDSRDADAIYSQLFSIEGTEVVIYIKYKDSQTYSVGLRAVSKINVGEIASTLGGGGHKLASGLRYKGKYNKLKKILISLVKDKKYYIY